VGDGKSEEAWEGFDDLTRPLRDHGIPILPVRGPKDAAEAHPKALGAWAKRFWPLGEAPWYTFRYRNLVILGLDTNLKALGALRKVQESWFEEALRNAEREANVSFVFVLLHHSPYSNADLPPQRDVFRTFVPPMEKSRKLHVIFSGSGGALERIHREGKWWITTAGGGGPAATIETDPSKRRYIDAYPGGPDRPAHFLTVTVESTRFTVEVWALDDEAARFKRTDRLVVGKPPP
jgi:hypothetical protein